MHKPFEKMKVKKRICINSLQAAICNVALFKSMKDKDFRESIFISYSDEGVILEAVNQTEWKRANDHIESFVHNKKIDLLIDGFDKEQYEGVINKGLKEINRKMRDEEEECPYINIIHYQKLRKSCEYMDKQKYVDPLKDWERKNKKNPNFAFLIVQPKQKFDEVKKGLLQYLLDEQIAFEQLSLDPLYFMYLYFYSPIKEKLRENINRKQIQINVQKQDKTVIRTKNFTNLNLNQYGYSIVEAQAIIVKTGVGLEVISESEIKIEVKNAKGCGKNVIEVIESGLEEAEAEFGYNFMVVPYKMQEEQKYKTLIQKYNNQRFTKQEIEHKLEIQTICQYDEIEFLSKISKSPTYQSWKVCINSCPFMVHQYIVSMLNIDTFIIYLDQLQNYYCNYMVRYYGIAIKYSRFNENAQPNQPISYFLIFDYSPLNLSQMIQTDMILDNMQVATIILQILYLANFLHSQQQPRCLGPIMCKQIFWPISILLPYLYPTEQETVYSIENDVKQIGMVLEQLLGGDEDDDLKQLLSEMVSANRYQRPSVKKCIGILQDLLCQ